MQRRNQHLSYRAGHHLHTHQPHRQRLLLEASTHKQHLRLQRSYGFATKRALNSRCLRQRSGPIGHAKTAVGSIGTGLFHRSAFNLASVEQAVVVLTPRSDTERIASTAIVQAIQVIGWAVQAASSKISALFSLLALVCNVTTIRVETIRTHVAAHSDCAAALGSISFLCRGRIRTRAIKTNVVVIKQPGATSEKHDNC